MKKKTKKKKYVKKKKYSKAIKRKTKFVSKKRIAKKKKVWKSLEGFYKLRKIILFEKELISGKYYDNRSRKFDALGCLMKSRAKTLQKKGLNDLGIFLIPACLNYLMRTYGGNRWFYNKLLEQSSLKKREKRNVKAKAISWLVTDEAKRFYERGW